MAEAPAPGLPSPPGVKDAINAAGGPGVRRTCMTPLRAAGAEHILSLVPGCSSPPRHYGAGVGIERSSCHGPGTVAGSSVASLGLPVVYGSTDLPVVTVVPTMVVSLSRQPATRGRGKRLGAGR